MAVVGYPVTGPTAAPRRGAHVAAGRRDHLRLVTEAELSYAPGGARHARCAPRARHASRAHGVLSFLATVGVLAGLWAGASALRAAGSAPIVPPPGSWKVAGGYELVVRPGQTVWSIASAMEPGADPRALVDEIDAGLPGGVLVAGTVLRVP